MADISMCSGDGCDKRKQCYRHTATPNPFLQAYFIAPPPSPCEFFWDNGNDNTDEIRSDGLGDNDKESNQQ